MVSRTSRTLSSVSIPCRPADAARSAKPRQLAFLYTHTSGYMSVGLYLGRANVAFCTVLIEGPHIALTHGAKPFGRARTENQFQMNPTIDPSVTQRSHFFTNNKELPDQRRADHLKHHYMNTSCSLNQANIAMTHQKMNLNGFRHQLCSALVSTSLPTSSTCL